jgi:hypothetical protein
MTTEKLMQETIDILIGKKIIDAKDNWIKLENGIVIYIEDSEIKMLND